MRNRTGLAISLSSLLASVVVAWAGCSLDSSRGPVQRFDPDGSSTAGSGTGSGTGSGGGGGGSGSGSGSGTGSGSGSGAGCGSGNGNGDIGSGHVGDVTVLVDGLDSPTQIVADRDYLYWVNTANGDNGSVMRVAKTGGLPQVLATSQTFPGSLVVDDTAVYWTNGGINLGSGQVMQVAKTGGPIRVVASGLNFPISLVDDHDYLYWSDDLVGVKRVAKRGGGVPQLLVASDAFATAIALDDTRVFFNDVITNTLRAVPKAGGPSAEIASIPDAFAAFLVVDRDDIYWHNGGVDSLWHTKTTGGAPVTAVFSGCMEMRFFTATRDALFITQMGEPFAPGVIRELPRRRGAGRIATPPDIGFWGIAVDDRRIYWTNEANGTVSSIARSDRGY